MDFIRVYLLILYYLAKHMAIISVSVLIFKKFIYPSLQLH